MTTANTHGASLGRRSLLRGSAALAGLWPLPSLGGVAGADAGPQVTMTLRSAPGVQATRHGDVALIVLDRPLQGNLLDEADYADLLAAFQTANEDASIHSIALAGRGAHFSKGIVESAPRVGELLSNEGALQGSGRLSIKPMVAVVQGRTVGLSAALALCADVRVANADAVFEWPDPRHAAIFLPRLSEEIGRANAQRFLLTGGALDAHEAWRLGFVQHVAAHPAEALDEAMAIAVAIGRRRHEQGDSS